MTRQWRFIYGYRGPRGTLAGNFPAITPGTPTSGEYRFVVFMTPSSQEMESLGIPGRFTMAKDTVVSLRQPDGQDLLSTMLREGVQRLIAEALQAEFAEFLSQFAGERDEFSRAAVVRNGFQPQREVLTWNAAGQPAGRRDRGLPPSELEGANVCCPRVTLRRAGGCRCSRHELQR